MDRSELLNQSVLMADSEDIRNKFFGQIGQPSYGDKFS